MYHSSSSVFMTNNMPSGVKKHFECIESCQIAKMFFSFFFFTWCSSNCMTLTWQFSHKTAASCTEKCIITFSSNLTSALRTFRTIAFLRMPFCYLYTCTQNGHMKNNRHMYMTWFRDRWDSCLLTFWVAPGYYKKSDVNKYRILKCNKM